MMKAVCNIISLLLRFDNLILGVMLHCYLTMFKMLKFLILFNTLTLKSYHVLSYLILHLHYFVHYFLIFCYFVTKINYTIVYNTRLYFIAYYLVLIIRVSLWCKQLCAFCSEHQNSSQINMNI